MTARYDGEAWECAVAMWTWVKIPKALAMVFFMLPWMTVSCSNQKVMTATGWSFVSGSYHLNPFLAHSMRVQSEVNHPNPVMIVAFGLTLLGLILSFQPMRRGAPGVIAASTGALIAILYFTHQIATKMYDDMGSGGTAGWIAATVQVTWEMGYWLTLGALASAIVMAGMAWNGKSRAALLNAGSD